jgi:hypothetical protein
MWADSQNPGDAPAETGDRLAVFGSGRRHSRDDPWLDVSRTGIDAGKIGAERQLIFVMRRSNWEDVSNVLDVAGLVEPTIAAPARTLRIDLNAVP